MTRAPSFMIRWLVAFAILASTVSLGGALLLDRDLRRERAGAAARGEMEAFLDGKLAGQILGGGGPSLMQGLAAPVIGRHVGGDAAAEVAAFRDRTGRASEQARVFLYRRGGAVTGSQTTWPSDVKPFGRDLVCLRLIDGAEAIAAVHSLPAGATLLIGRRVERAQPLSDRVLRTSGLTLVGLVLAGGAIGGLFSIGYGRRLRAITQACERVEAGDMAARAPDAELSDEFGALSRHVNRMLDRVSRYVLGMRDVSDEIAHDLRTPVNRIQGRLTGVRAAIAPSRSPELEMAAADLADLGRVIDDFLWLREVESGQGGQTSFFDLKALSQQVAEDHALLALEAKAVTLSVAGDALEVMGVQSLIIRALDNIIANAVKFTPPGGAIDIRTMRRGALAEVTVEDTGPGLPEPLLLRAIQPGVRGADAGAGHGLGLAIAASVARRHGGDVTLDNRAQGGLCVRLALPAFRP